MFCGERKFLEWVEKNIHVFVLLSISLIGCFIRFSLRECISGDAEGCLMPWYNEIMENGKIRALSHQVGNYNVLYQFLIALMTYLPFFGLSSYKLVSGIFDFFLAFAVGDLVYYVTDEGRKQKALAAYGMVILSPVVFMNSAAWAQCDSIYTFWLILTLLFFLKEKYLAAFVFFGIAFSFKLQAVFLLPFLLFAYFRLRKFSVLNFGFVPAVMYVSGIPALVMGRPMTDIFIIYFGQVEENWRLSWNYPSFWLLLTGVFGEDYDSNLFIYDLHKGAAISVAVCMLMAWMVWWIWEKIEMNQRNMLYMAFILVYTAVLFLPAMHERYGYVYEIMAIVIAFLNKKTVPFLGMLLGISMFTYGYYLYGRLVDYDLLAVANCGAYMGYAVILMKQMRNSEPVNAV